MARRRITCPQSAHLEQLELEDTPSGLVVVECSRLEREGGECERDCTRRLDRRARRDAGGVGERVLVVVSYDGPAKPTAEHVADLLASDGLHVEIANAGLRPPPPEGYECVLLIGLDPAVIAYARTHAIGLARIPTGALTLGVRDDAATRLPIEARLHPSITAAIGEIPQASALARFARALADEIVPLESVEARC